ncbi:uncharacterized protein BJX67DRAFT_321764 [Aspergillus lucknowensis]|uniref:Uncharacterized protein n=1 Tax=Aspergillus lucknowensis TaxID=176173 RepID=A0ABR4LZ51_9EURO
MPRNLATQDVFDCQCSAEYGNDLSPVERPPLYSSIYTTVSHRSSVLLLSVSCLGCALGMTKLEMTNGPIARATPLRRHFELWSCRMTPEELSISLVFRCRIQPNWASWHPRVQALEELLGESLTNARPKQSTFAASQTGAWCDDANSRHTEKALSRVR